LQAWVHGPVCRPIYNEYKTLGYSPIEPNQTNNNVEDETLAKLLLDVNNEYSQFSAKRLESMTHQEMPWLNARGNTPPYENSNEVLDYNDIKVFFDRLNSTGYEYT